MTTMNNEDSVDPTVVAEPVAWAVMVRGRVQKLVVREDVADEVACKLREQDPRADAVPLYTADQMREVIAAERERSHELLQAADHIRAGLEAKLAALSAALAEKEQPK